MLVSTRIGGRMLNSRALQVSRKETVMKTARMLVVIAILLIGVKASFADEPSVKQSLPGTAPAVTAVPFPPSVLPADCPTCEQGHAHGHNLLCWLFYHPPAGYCCRCLPRPVPCCTPPLYAWFPCQGFGHGSFETCTSCGEAAGPCKTDCYRYFHPGK